MFFAPITGAWIETVRVLQSHRVNHSHLSRVRGLKRADDRHSIGHSFAPITGAWIETTKGQLIFSTALSHLSRVRGLKRCFLLLLMFYGHFAPITGAWIETILFTVGRIHE